MMGVCVDNGGLSARVGTGILCARCFRTRPSRERQGQYQQVGNVFAHRFHYF